MTRTLIAAALGIALTAGFPAAQSGDSQTLDIYIADTEGGKATLFVAPGGETVLIDSGNPGERDGDRIMSMIEDAGVTQIDHLISTHYHVDHIGGLQGLAARIPIRHFVDHGPSVEAREQVEGFQQAYADLSAKAWRTIVHAGNRLAVSGLDWRIVAAGAQTIPTTLPGGGQANPACADFVRKDAGVNENNQSVGSVVTFGEFKVIDLGDLMWNDEFDLVCPRNLVGPVDLYLVTHHGLDASGSPAFVHAIRPRVAVMQNGTRKGGAVGSYETLRSSPGLEDIWQLHWSYAGGIEHNPAGVFIANIDPAETIAEVLTAPTPGRGGARGRGARGGGPGRGLAAHAPAYWIRIAAARDGSFTVTNSRNGFSKTYQAR